MAAMLSFNEKDFKDILNGLVDGVITINHQGIIISFNKTAETMFGYTSAEVVGHNVNMLMPEPVKSAHDIYIDNYLTTGDEHIIGIGRDVTALRKNGEEFPMRLSVIELPAKVKGDRWFIGSCRDITLQVKQEEQLRRSLKMEAVGKLASGLAHDYNNKLGVIMGYADILAEQAKEHPKFLEYIEAIQHATESATNLTQKLLSITRKRVDFAQAININDILKEEQQLLSKTLTPRINLSIKFENDLWSTFVDKGSLEDTVLNLGINAMHAMPEGGDLTVATSNIHIASIDAQVLRVSPGDYVKLSITDTGIGMTNDVISHIFEPFYSTKGEMGTGLGLSQVYNFVTEFKGTIRVYSEVGIGTCFSIYLPRYMGEDSESEAADLDKNKFEGLHGTARILVVDDEVAISELSKNILSSHGYSVYCVSSGKQALNFLKNEKVDLVLSDVIMPEMDGFELAHIIRHTYPDIKIQLCSGFSESKGKTVTIGSLSENLLEKPFTVKQLLTSIKEALNK